MIRWLMGATCALALMSGCKQGDGDRCHFDTDCAEGLLCDVPMGETRQSGGVCRPAGSDLATATDAGAVD